MNDHVLTTLEAAGVHSRPTALLERDGAFFALTPDTLAYADGEGVQAAALRDLTRIHTDDAGQLRVKSRDGDVIVAPLAGFDVPRTQLFFAEVRSVTARAKALPSAPVPVAGGSWKTGWSPDGTAPVTAAPAIMVPVGSVPAAPVVTATPGGTSGAVAPRPVTDAVRDEEADGGSAHVPSAQKEAEPTASFSETGAGDAVASRPRSVNAPFGSPAGLVAHAEQLGRAGVTLRLLAVLMFLTGGGVGALQWLGGEALGGLWTFGVGAVGAFALVVFAKATRVLSLLALALFPERP